MNFSEIASSSVFLATPHGTARDFRMAELGNRCFVARGLNPEINTVVGIATEQYERGRGFSLDICHLYRPEWSIDDEARMKTIQDELGYFVNPTIIRVSEDEYPQQRN